MDLTKSFPPHPSEDILEEYVFGRLPEALVDQVEEHLLICHTCQDVVEQADRFVSAMRIGGRHPIPAAGLLAAASWRRIAPGASVAAVLAVAIVAALAVRKPTLGSPNTPINVSLSSLRGFEAMTPAPAGRPLQLGIEAPDLTRGKQYRVEVVDTVGREVWKGAVREADSKLVATMTRPLSAGVYWVRLFNGDSELVREFGMSVN